MNEMMYMKHLAQNESSANDKGIHRDKKRGERILKSLKDSKYLDIINFSLA